MAEISSNNDDLNKKLEATQKIADESLQKLSKLYVEVEILSEELSASRAKVETLKLTSFLNLTSTRNLSSSKIISLQLYSPISASKSRRVIECFRCSFGGAHTSL